MCVRPKKGLRYLDFPILITCCTRSLRVYNVFKFAAEVSAAEASADADVDTAENDECPTTF